MKITIELNGRSLSMVAKDSTHGTARRLIDLELHPRAVEEVAALVARLVGIELAQAIAISDGQDV